MESLLQIAVFLLLLGAGYFFGSRAEARHYREIRAGEDRLRHILVLTDRLPPPGMLRDRPCLVSGNVVISVDYFKTIVAGLRNLVGGNISAYESLLDRARREAILRMQQQAAELDARAVINMKFETSRISGNAGSAVGAVEVLAYGTALVAPR